MRRLLLSGLFCGLAITAVPAALAQSLVIPPDATDARWEALAPGERAMVDRLAADFYESDLRLAQSRQIEARAYA